MPIPVIVRRPAYGPYLSYNRTNVEENNYTVGNGYYTGRYLTVRIYHHSGFRSIGTHTTLEAQHGSTEYVRTYNRVFNDRGLRLICSRFHRDIHDILRAPYKKLFSNAG